jgi:prepilin-type N-terminal cleavage/methylation domain-containing protein
VRRGFTLVELLVLLLIAALIAGLVLTGFRGEGPGARTGAAQFLVESLDQSARMYWIDHGEYPENGSGTTTLAARLRQVSPKGPRYYQFGPDDLDAHGNVRSPIDSSAILYYRNNRELRGLIGHNRESFDLWCRDARGEAEGVNNWRDR